MKKVTIILVVLLFTLLCGCEDANKTRVDKLKALQQEKGSLQEQLARYKSENLQLQKQLNVMAGLGPKQKGEKLYEIQRVKLTRYTNLYDKDKDGKKEKLIVYLQPIDKQGDIIKAGGSVDVELWDLNRKDGEAMLGRWHVNSDELKEIWHATIVTTYYRLVFDIGEKVEFFEEPLTVKVSFTDYLTGKVFTEQRTIKP